MRVVIDLERSLSPATYELQNPIGESEIADPTTWDRRQQIVPRCTPMAYAKADENDPTKGHGV